MAGACFLYMRRDPVVHFVIGRFVQRKDLFVLHLAFFVAVFAVPAFAFHAALVEVDLLLRQHDDVRRDAEAELAIAPGKDVVVFKAVQHRQDTMLFRNL